MTQSPPIRNLLDSLAQPFTGEALFDCLTNVVFFIKNHEGRYLVVNNTLVERCGLRLKSQLVGRTPSEIFQKPFGEAYEAQDRRILQTGRSLARQLELHLYPTRDVGWCITNKQPLLRKDGTVAGIVGVSQDLQLPDDKQEEYQHIAKAVNYAQSHLESSPGVQQLAEIAGMSRFQLDRRIQLAFGVTTGQWLLKLKIDCAQQLLQQSDQPIAEIALQAGYTDQSAFTRQFRQATGLSPREFRLACRSH